MAKVVITIELDNPAFVPYAAVEVRRQLRCLYDKAEYGVHKMEGELLDENGQTCGHVQLVGELDKEQIDDYP